MVDCTYIQCYGLETMVSRLDCTPVHFLQISVSRPDGQGRAVCTQVSRLKATVFFSHGGIFMHHHRSHLELSELVYAKCHAHLM